MKISILHLYHDLLNLYGETGNVKMLSKHLTDQGVELSVEKKSVNDEIDFALYDFIYMGSGTEKNQLVALNDSLRLKDALIAAVDSGTVFLATGNSYEIFGESITDAGDNTIEALNIFGYRAKRVKERITGDIVYKADFLGSEIIGFVNKMSMVYDIDNHLFKVEFGFGDNEKNDFEGIRHLNFFGTSVIGPVLVRNPHFLNYLVEMICLNKDGDFDLSEIKYEYEEKAYETTLNELNRRNLKN